MKITKGKKYLCLKDMYQNSVLLFKNGNSYNCKEDNCLAAEERTKLHGFNADIAAEYFSEQ